MEDATVSDGLMGLLIGVCGVLVGTGLCAKGWGESTVTPPQAERQSVGELPYNLGLWSRSLGNHRANAVVMQAAEAVRVRIPWRRRDADPEKKDIIILDAATDTRIKNLVRVNVNREFADLVFQPTSGPGAYQFYYMPYTHSGPNHQFVTTYAPPVDQADPAWLERNKLTPDALKQGAWQSLPEAKAVNIQARSEFDRMDPMEVIATAEETRSLAAKYPDRTYLVFPEDRRFPIRMTEDLPVRWIHFGPKNEFTGAADRGEFYVFQLGVYAVKQPVEDLRIEFGPLDGLVAADAFRCFSLGGVDWAGRAFRKTCGVEPGKVGAFWCGVQIPKDAKPGLYEGKVIVRPKNAEPTEIQLHLDVASAVLDDAGDSDLPRLARLRWLDSTIGLDDDIVAPYTPLTIEEGGERGKGEKGNVIVGCLGREVEVGSGGFLTGIRSGGREILSRPVSMYVETDAGAAACAGDASKILEQAPGVVTWESAGSCGPFTTRCEARMEFDGYLNFRVTFRAREAARVKDIGLEIPLRRDAATYLMGMGRKGGVRPAEWQWTWDATRANNSVWIGDVDAGLQCKLKDVKDAWNLYNFAESGLPQAWSNGGKGGCTVRENGAEEVLVRAFSGERELKAGEELAFCFGLLITPVKPLDPRHWSWRYQHQYVRLGDLDSVEGNILNVHHGNELNPHINYPFNSSKLLGSYVRQAHQRGIKVKIYYTVRELSNHVAELWPLRSLGTEIFTDGPGGGCSWLCEHLANHYAPAWHEPNLPNDDIDGAIATAGLSRWHNYYLEGLAWLLKNVEIDGLYLDGIGYDRGIMQRLRKVMERTRPGSLIDFHSGNNFDPAYGLSSPANQYLEHFPYIDSLWFGEGYDYNETPDYWLVEISGIPFGLFGEMLQGGGNPWRGMLYGMTNRLGWQGDPRPIWKLWDAFGIQDARMFGYWDKACPVKTDNPDVLATVYVQEGEKGKGGKALIAVASWAKDPVQCKLSVDWPALGLDAAKVKLHAPGVEKFQEERVFVPGEAIPIEPGRGWLIVAGIE